MNDAVSKLIWSLGVAVVVLVSSACHADDFGSIIKSTASSGGETIGDGIDQFIKNKEDALEYVQQVFEEGWQQIEQGP
jgi:hypothetical protein